MHLLIVDDHAINLQLLRAQLLAEGHTVLEATNGVEALEVLENATVDAVISDILMPNMDGFRLCLEIRKSEKLNALPFILYTSTYNSPKTGSLRKVSGPTVTSSNPLPPGSFSMRCEKPSRNPAIPQAGLSPRTTRLMCSGSTTQRW